MRRLLASACGASMSLAFVLLADGCTFLVSFDDVPVPTEDATDGPRVPDAPLPDSSQPIDHPPDIPNIPPTPACDIAFPLGEVKGCETFVEGAEVCADSAGITEYPGDRSLDLVACTKTGASCVRHCAACAHLPQGFPDQCDQCIGKADGYYCGTEMGWQPIHFRLRVTCGSGRVANATPCANGCDSNGASGNAVCNP